MSIPLQHTVGTYSHSMVNVSSEVQHREVSSGILKKKNQFNKVFIVAAEIIITVATKTHIPPVL